MELNNKFSLKGKKKSKLNRKNLNTSQKLFWKFQKAKNIRGKNNFRSIFLEIQTLTICNNWFHLAEEWALLDLKGLVVVVEQRCCSGGCGGGGEIACFGDGCGGDGKTVMLWWWMRWWLRNSGALVVDVVVTAEKCCFGGGCGGGKRSWA